MNITDVLAAGSFEGLNTEQKQSQNQLNTLAAFDLLFNILMKCYTEEQPDKAGQTAGELGQDENILAENDQTNKSLEDTDILAQNSYRQILQNLFPVGMEADYGIRAEKNPIDIFLAAANMHGDGKDFVSTASTLAKIDLDPTQFQVLKAKYMADAPSTQFGAELRSLLEKVNQNYFSPEQKGSVQAQEFVQNTQILSRLQELSGQIEVVGESNEKSLEKTLRTVSNQFNGWFEQPLNSKTSTQTYNIQSEEGFSPTVKLNSIDYKPADMGNTGNTGNTSNTNNTNNTNNTGNTENVDYDAILQQNARVELSYSDKTTTATNMRNTTEVATTGFRVAEQVLDAIKKQDLNSSKEVRELSIQLHPAELGKVNISLKMENGLLNVVINASEHNTGLLLQNNIQDLKNGLAQIGVTCGSFEMNYQPDGQAEPDTRSHEFFTQQKAYKEDYDSVFPEELYSKLSLYTDYNGSSSRINFRA